MGCDEYLMPCTSNVRFIFLDSSGDIWRQIVVWFRVSNLVFASSDRLHYFMWALRAIPGLPGMFDRVIQAIVIEGAVDISLSPYAYWFGLWVHALLLEKLIVVYLKHEHVLLFISEFMESLRVEGRIKAVRRRHQHSYEPFHLLLRSRGI